MKMDHAMITQIQQVVAEINKNYDSHDVLMAKDGRHLPSRSTIILILKELRRIMFPGYFGDEDLSTYVGDYFVGSNLNHVYQVLKEQIVTALIYRQSDTTAGRRDFPVFDQPAAIYSTNVVKRCAGRF